MRLIFTILIYQSSIALIIDVAFNNKNTYKYLKKNKYLNSWVKIVLWYLQLLINYTICISV